MLVGLGWGRALDQRTNERDYFNDDGFVVVPEAWQGLRDDNVATQLLANLADNGGGGLLLGFNLATRQLPLERQVLVQRELRKENAARAGDERTNSGDGGRGGLAALLNKELTRAATFLGGGVYSKYENLLQNLPDRRAGPARHQVHPGGLCGRLRRPHSGGHPRRGGPFAGGGTAGGGHRPRHGSVAHLDPGADCHGRHQSVQKTGHSGPAPGDGGLSKFRASIIGGKKEAAVRQGPPLLLSPRKLLRTSLDHVGNEDALLHQFLVGCCDLGFRKVVHHVTGDDLVAAGRGRAPGHAVPDIGVKAVAPV